MPPLLLLLLFHRPPLPRERKGYFSRKRKKSFCPGAEYLGKTVLRELLGIVFRRPCRHAAFSRSFLYFFFAGNPMMHDVFSLSFLTQEAARLQREGGGGGGRMGMEQQQQQQQQPFSSLSSLPHLQQQQQQQLQQHTSSSSASSSPTVTAAAVRLRQQQQQQQQLRRMSPQHLK